MEGMPQMSEEEVNRRPIEMGEVSYGKLLEVVATKGLADEEVRALYVKWCEDRESRIKGMYDKREARRLNVRMEIDRARIYREGKDDESRDAALDDAYRIATQEPGLEDLVAEIQSFSDVKS